MLQSENLKDSFFYSICYAIRYQKLEKVTTFYDGIE